MKKSDKALLKTYGQDTIQSAIASLCGELLERHEATERLLIMGIANGGIPFAKKLTDCLSLRMGRSIPMGCLNIMFHRDDIGSRPIPAAKPETVLPEAVDGAVVLLADDVIFSGRTIRAALNELFDAGRPDKVELAVLCDRGHRKLPMAPDYVGFREKTDFTAMVKVTLDPDKPERDRIQIYSA